MPKLLLNLQLMADEGTTTAGSDVGSIGEIAGSAAENPNTGVEADGGIGEQGAPAQDQTIPEETFDSLIKGKYKKDYDKAVKAAVNRRFKNQQNLQSQIDSIDPIVRSLASRYGVVPNADGSIPIDQLQAKIDADNSAYEQEAFQRGMSVEDLKQMKRLERENAQLRMDSRRSREQQEWDGIVAQGEDLKKMYPDFDLDAEMNDPQFGRLLATMQKSGFKDAVRTAYEVMHRDDIMGGAMKYAVSQAEKKLENAVRSGTRRPAENGTTQTSSSTVGNMDPSRLTKEQLEDIKRRAERGERITFQ